MHNKMPQKYPCKRKEPTLKASKTFSAQRQYLMNELNLHYRYRQTVWKLVYAIEVHFNIDVDF